MIALGCSLQGLGHLKCQQYQLDRLGHPISLMLMQKEVSNGVGGGNRGGVRERGTMEG